MLSKISEISGNRYRVAKQSHLTVCLSSKSREIGLTHPAPCDQSKGQSVDGVRKPKTDDPTIHDPRRVKRHPSSLARRSSKFCSQKCLRLWESQRAPRNVHRFNGHFPFPNLRFYVNCLDLCESRTPLPCLFQTGETTDPRQS